jgi:hypothetical protein
MVEINEDYINLAMSRTDKGILALIAYNLHKISEAIEDATLTKLNESELIREELKNIVKSIDSNAQWVKEIEDTLRHDYKN